MSRLPKDPAIQAAYSRVLVARRHWPFADPTGSDDLLLALLGEIIELRKTATANARAISRLAKALGEREP
jgi:hypothetical protein